MEETAKRHLILVGGGHAHVFVLRSLAMRRAPGLQVTLVSPASQATYSGMVPGVLAGQYDLSEAQIDVRALAARAGAAFVPDRVVRIDADRRVLALAERPPLTYDFLSLDIGSQPAAADRVEPDAPVVLVKPIERAAAGIAAALAAPAPAAGRRAVVIGAGAGGTEIAFALAARLRHEGKGSVTVCDLAGRPVATRDASTSRAVERALAQHRITFRGGVDVTCVSRDGVTLASGELLPADLVVWATGAAGPALFADSGLPVDQRGFLQVGDDLRCAAHPEIFAAGDCATLSSHRDLAKAGVYAVRQGPVLAANLRSAARGGGLRTFRPQRHFLSLMNTGDGRGILSYRGFAVHGRSVWWLKDRIDRAFIRRYARPAIDPAQAMNAPMVPCGGCAAKVGADVLGRVLSKLGVAAHSGVPIGVAEADDAAVFEQPPGTLAVATVDAFPPFIDDLYVVGQVAANNAASDLYAMGAEGSVALAMVCLPRTDARQDEEQLEQFLRGALLQLERLGIPLAGGHTIAGEQAIVGFSMHGWVAPGDILRKGGGRPGDVLVLGKPLGTGVILAAARVGVAAAEWVEATLSSMLRSNAPLMRLLREHGVRACTDVTGFGLIGHLDEMLRASGVGARLIRSAIPALPGARELLAAGWRSSFHASNQRAQKIAATDTDPLWLDPQTSGGLLAAVPPQHLDALRAACAQAGEPLYVIGELTDVAQQVVSD
jgi:selenide,water dikinase